jgi:hypothetical protein
MIPLQTLMPGQLPLLPWVKMPLSHNSSTVTCQTILTAAWTGPGQAAQLQCEPGGHIREVWLCEGVC